MVIKIAPKVVLTIFGLVVTLTFNLLTFKSNLMHQSCKFCEILTAVEVTSLPLYPRTA